MSGTFSLAVSKNILL